MNVAKRLSELEERAVSLSEAGTPRIAWRTDRLTDDERARLGTLGTRCASGGGRDLSRLTVPELLELRHLRTLATPALSDAEVARARESWAAGRMGEYEPIARQAKEWQHANGLGVSR